MYGYKSGHFKLSKQNYHSTFKKILVVKHGIKKFEFHLNGYHFIVELNMTSFPSMLVPKSKKLSNLQLIQWSQWFSNYSFIVRHIKGKENIVPDFVSRLSYKKPVTLLTSPIHSLTFEQMDPIPTTMRSEIPLPFDLSDLPLEFSSIY